MLPPAHGCEPGDVVCCNTFFATGEAILDLGLAAVNDESCYPDECEAPKIEGFVTMGRGQEYPIFDALIVSFMALSPTPRSSDAHRNISGAPLWRITWQVKLVESGWMVFVPSDDEEVVPAPPELIHSNARHAFSHIESLYRALANAVITRSLPGLCGSEVDQSCYANISELTPLEPSGITVGWVFTITHDIDLRGGCVGPS